LSKSIRYYNVERQQENLGWRSPNQFELDMQTNKNYCQLILHDYKQNLPSLRMGFSRHKTAKIMKKKKGPKKFSHFKELILFSLDRIIPR